MLKIALPTRAAGLLVCGTASAQYYNYGTGSNSSDHYVDGHYNRNGTYTQPHYQTNPERQHARQLWGRRQLQSPHGRLSSELLTAQRKAPARKAIA